MTLYEALKGRFGLSDTCGECPHHNRDCYTQNVNLHDICEVINAPGMKPKRGRWEFVQYDANPKIGNYHCSQCGLIAEPLSYCPHCGAKMEGEKDE